MNKRCVVIIPIYKLDLYNFEILSLHRLYQVLGHKYDIKYLTYEELNTLEYANIAYQYGYDCVDRIIFNKSYFISAHNCGYNLLMTNYKLYELLLDYDYMFLYQLDCYIFKDDLEYWMNLNLPQIECVYYSDIYGGFCNGQGLRKISKFYNFCKKNEKKIKSFYFDILLRSTFNYYFLTQENVELNPYLNELRWESEDSFYFFNFKTDINKFLNFGWSNYYDDKFSKYGLPTLLHYFQKEEWSYRYIGDWENDLDQCINNPLFLSNK